MRVDIFDFDLPEDRIALKPTAQRDGARMLHVVEGVVADRMVSDLPNLLGAGDLLVVNDTRVLPAQLQGVRRAPNIGGSSHDVAIDVTLHKDLGNMLWRGFVRPAKRLQIGDELVFSPELKAVVEKRDGAEAQLKFHCAAVTFEEALAGAGVVPLPPYIARKRPVDDEDKKRYQTIFANESGSVAAPTAGLHFTDSLLARLSAKGVEMEKITLHVGAGTFLPVSVDDTSAHQMHSEWGQITLDQARRINETRARGGRVVAVGTTSLRLLESAASDDGEIMPFSNETDIFITPGYRFKAVDLLMTNFHLPRSTLFMLVCAFAGTQAMKAAYAHAIANGYRFYSYGDACLLERTR